MTGADEALESVGATFVRLGLSMGRHFPGYVDSYYGPEEIAHAVEAEGRVSLAELDALAHRLATDAAADPSLPPPRREYLQGEIAAMQTTLRILQGETLDIVDEVRRLYGIAPVWTDETEFTETHRALAAILPGSDPLSERVPAFRERLRITAQTAAPIIGRLGAEFRERSRARFDLPPEEDCTFSFVRDQPWTAYNWYDGASKSRIEFDEDHPIYLHQLPEIVAHEAYPGHHTEHVVKEVRLYRGQGRLEHAVILNNMPSSLISEGIAENALSVITEADELIACYGDVLDAAGLPREEAARVHEFVLATRPLARVADNQLLLLHGEGASDEEVVAYGVRYALSTEGNQRRLLRFHKDPLWRSYGFNYSLGRDIVEAYLSASSDRLGAFARLLQEPMTPGQLLAATADRA